MTDINSLDNIVSRLEAATARLESLAHGGTTSSAAVKPATATSAKPDETPFVVTKYDELINESLKTYLELSKAIGGTVAEQSDHVNNVFQAQRDFVLITTRSQKAEIGTPVFMDLLGPTQRALEKVIEVKDRNRGTEFYNHLCTVQEGVPALGWITVVRC
ncbi:adenylate cyclase-associated CAP [Jimgerdemannia flammicorona]|uniref:Adenylate cyclase-associated CAP n=1 Tax=Jimgerdemannia flammicorona TaxID=994334 RepID=A0A433BAC5_9FUNG|nr:adenylate cyclase-associated CAP [Jimgerdemannia flammicorona]